MSLVIDAINFDCSDPRGLAEFWAAVIGVDDVQYASGPVDVSLGGNSVRVVEEWASVRSNIPASPILVFGRVQEGKTVKNRLHLDLQADDMRAEVARLAQRASAWIAPREVAWEPRRLTATIAKPTRSARLPSIAPVGTKGPRAPRMATRSVA